MRRRSGKTRLRTTMMTRRPVRRDARKNRTRRRLGKTGSCPSACRAHSSSAATRGSGHLSQIERTTRRQHAGRIDTRRTNRTAATAGTAILPSTKSHHPRVRHTPYIPQTRRQTAPSRTVQAITAARCGPQTRHTLARTDETVEDARPDADSCRRPRNSAPTRTATHGKRFRRTTNASRGPPHAGPCGDHMSHPPTTPPSLFELRASRVMMICLDLA